MFDTVRFKIPFSYELWANVALSCEETTTQDNLSSVKKDPYLNGSVIIPPYDQSLSILGYNYQIYLEGSLPRLQFGTNTRLLYLHQIPGLLQRIHQALLKKFGIFPSWETWEIQRADFCYSWKGKTEEEVLRIIEFLMSLDYPRKSINIHPKESVTFFGRSSPIKFYLKYPEYSKKGYHELFKMGLYDLADEALKLAENALRFEVEARKSKLQTIYDKPIITYKDLINEDIWLNFLNETLNTLLRNSNRTSLDDDGAITKLIATYGSQKGVRLFCFWKTYYSKDRHIKRLLRKHFNATTILKNLREISNAGVGFPNENVPLPFDFSIPSKNVVNFEPAPPAIAGGAVDKTIQVAEEIDDKKTKQLDFDKLLEKF